MPLASVTWSLPAPRVTLNSSTVTPGSTAPVLSFAAANAPSLLLGVARQGHCQHRYRQSNECTSEHSRSSSGSGQIQPGDMKQWDLDAGP